MFYGFVCILVFVVTYSFTLLYTSIFYHRGFTHRAIRLSKLTRWLAIHTGNWVTGLDPKTWSCMHRLHHMHADTKLDPHSPKHGGFFRLMLVQLWSYGKTTEGLVKKKRRYTRIVKDLDFPVNWLNRRGFWYLPHLLHLGIGIALAGLVGIELGVAYFAGMMSHPFQGWAVNAFGHQVGYRNFNTPDLSTNNTLVAWLVMGEGYQNNHHHAPRSAKFSAKRFEVDWGYGICRLLAGMGLIEFNQSVREIARIKKAA